LGDFGPFWGLFSIKRGMSPYRYPIPTMTRSLVNG
jgi:hypothetical protein